MTSQFQIIIFPPYIFISKSKKTFQNNKEILVVSAVVCWLDIWPRVDSFINHSSKEQYHWAI